MPEPKWEPVSLTEMMNAGVLMNVNETRLWPLGLALVWTYDPITGEAVDLHIREWQWEDGHHEAIEEAADDPILLARRDAYSTYVKGRAATMPSNESADALLLLDWAEGWDLMDEPEVPSGGPD
jgi:hypothetical protein